MTFRFRNRKAKTKPAFAFKKQVVHLKDLLHKPTKVEVNSIVKKQIKKAGETKYADVEEAFTMSNSGVGINPQVLTGGITQGITDNATRIGDKIKPVFLHMHGQFYCGTSSEPWRLLIVQGKNENDTTPPLTQILAYTNSVARELMNSPYNFDKMHTFKVLCDRRFKAIQQISGNTTEGHPFSVKISGKKMANVNYIGATTRVASGGIYTYAFSDSASNPPVLYGITRITYKDT